MKVALVSRYPSDPGRPRGGVESVTVVLVRALARLDDLDVHVVTLERGRRQIGIESHDGATVHRLPGSRWPQLADVLGGPGRKRLVKYLSGLRPDVVHAHETYGLTLGDLPLPYVFTVHGFDHENLMADAARLRRIRSRLWKLAERRGFSRQRHVISITPYVRQMVEPLTGAAIYDIDNPVDERFFSVGRSPQPGRVLCVGWLSERKNPIAAVEAFALAQGRRGGRLVFAGQATQQEYRERLVSCIRSHGLEDQVELLGYVRHDRLMQELTQASVFLLPSRQENSPMAIAEAMAAGLPVIASNRCGMPFMVEEGTTGFLIDPEDPDQIADRLAMLLSDPALVERMGQAGRRVAERRFHPDAVARRTRAVYERICQLESAPAGRASPR